MNLKEILILFYVVEKKKPSRPKDQLILMLFFPFSHLSEDLLLPSTPEPLPLSLAAQPEACLLFP